MGLIRRDSPYRHWEWSDPASGDLLRLVPERGGLVTGWRCGGEEILYFDAERFADPSKSVRGGIPVLFPICGGLPGDQLPLPQGNFTLPQHGFARDQSWQLAELADGAGVRLSLCDTPTTRAAFPFGFALSLDLRLEASALAIAATVSHRHEGSGGHGDGDPGPMPFSLGLHPYFNVSSLEAARVEGVPPVCFNHLTMAAGSTAEQLAELRAGHGIDLLVRPREADLAGPVQLIDSGTGRCISLELSAPMDLVVLWSDPPRPMVCLEPWSGPRSSVISGDHRLELAPGEAMQLGCRYRIS